ncbi:TrbL/VirB6 plasmid conjugal transfer protein [Caballeronia glebae]|uniref:TrbL/VirB6 plasmid conjugal transfer protein n=1 Tax=Caballeronia glebae TaxID=1777143 RepID=A0A158D4Z7_9BURK|nr:type IV secretion system protein [Caballeronia glebae]SAK89543.1 TrbL/VirB6 plasmid conjugal transfer protein [Caballeronia glebae]
MGHPIMRVLRPLFIVFALMLGFAGTSTIAFAQTTTTANVATTATASGTTDTSKGNAVASKDGDFANGATNAANQIHALLGNVFATAVSASANVMDEANKFAWGLGVISLVLMGVRFAGTHHPISAWVDLFEELATLGIFVALYLGYSTSASGFWTWFEQLAGHISGADNGSVGAAMGKLAGVMFDALKSKFSIFGLMNLGGSLADVIVLGISAVAMCVASIVFIFFTAIGQVQAAVGIVLGPIAIALGFSSYTRSYFKKWLDWMISAGMYVVIVAILVKLVGTSIESAITKATQVGGNTTLNGAYVLDLSIFVLLLSFEIPKLATIFGGGASATGTGPLKLLKGAL